jgi:hypothetical protein
MINRSKARAIMLLTHYFKTVFEQAGLKFDNDNEAEIAEIINCIFDTIIEQS